MTTFALYTTMTKLNLLVCCATALGFSMDIDAEEADFYYYKIMIGCAHITKDFMRLNRIIDVRIQFFWGKMHTSDEMTLSLLYH